MLTTLTRDCGNARDRGKPRDLSSPLGARDRGNPCDSKSHVIHHETSDLLGSIT